MSKLHSTIASSRPCLPGGGACVCGGSESERAGFESRAASLLSRPLVRDDHREVAALVAALDKSVLRGVWDLRELRLYSVRARVDKAWARLSGVPGVARVPEPRVQGLAEMVPSVARVRGPKVAGWRGATPKASHECAGCGGVLKGASGVAVCCRCKRLARVAVAL
jgi:hypothetical protein